MRQGNHSNAKWALAVAALVVLVSGSMVLGSNMGFKLNMPIEPQLLVLPQGFNIVSIPEPATFAMAGLAVAVLAWRRRLSRK